MKQERWLPKIAMGFLIYTAAGNIFFPDVKNYVNNFAYDTLCRPIGTESEMPSARKLTVDTAMRQPHTQYWTRHEGKPKVVRAEDSKVDTLVVESIGYLAGAEMMDEKYIEGYKDFIWQWRHGRTKDEDFWNGFGRLHFDRYLEGLVQEGLVHTIGIEDALLMREDARSLYLAATERQPYVQSFPPGAH